MIFFSINKPLKEKSEDIVNAQVLWCVEVRNSLEKIINK